MDGYGGYLHFAGEAPWQPGTSGEDFAKLLSAKFADKAREHLTVTDRIHTQAERLPGMDLTPGQASRLRLAFRSLEAAYSEVVDAIDAAEDGE